jgi:iron complex transport system ATP-binding protein
MPQIDNNVMLEARGLRVAIGQRALCRRLDLAFSGGQCWGMLGRNGCGKTTLLHTLAGLLPAAGGELRLDGEALSRLPRRRIARRLGLLLQQQDTRFPMRVDEAVLAGRYAHLGPWRQPSGEDLRKSALALERVGLASLGGRNLQTLSGGELQRVAIATLLAQAPPLLLLDEPVSHLDLHEQTRILRLLREMARQGSSVVMSLHDINQALRYCSHLLLIHHGRVLHGSVARLGTASLLARVFNQPLTQLNGPHGRLLLAV